MSEATALQWMAADDLDGLDALAPMQARDLYMRWVDRCVRRLGADVLAHLGHADLAELLRDLPRLCEATITDTQSGVRFVLHALADRLAVQRRTAAPHDTVQPNTQDHDVTQLVGFILDDVVSMASRALALQPLARIERGGYRALLREPAARMRTLALLLADERVSPAQCASVERILQQAEIDRTRAAPAAPGEAHMDTAAGPDT